MYHDGKTAVTCRGQKNRDEKAEKRIKYKEGECIMKRNKLVSIAAITVALGNSFIGLIKGTSLAFVCAVVEMTAAGKIIAGRTYRYFEVYVSLAIIYWIITIIVEQGIKLIEKKIRIPENAPAIQTDEGALNQ